MPNAPGGRRTGDGPVTQARPSIRARGRFAGPLRLLLAAGAVVAALVLGAVALGGLGAAGFGAVVPPAANATPAAPIGSGSDGSGGTAAPTPQVASGSPPAPSGSPSVPPATPSPTPEIPAARLQSAVDSLRSRLSIPGVSVAILWDDGRTWVGAAGAADVAAGRAVTPDSGFALASISKTFTAAVILELVEEGRLRLDEPVAPRLPEYHLDKRITVRMLLDHTSGLPDYFLNPRIDKPLQSAPDATWTPARAWSYVSSRRAVPGTRWTYSNANYLLLGELVAEVTGHPLSTEIRNRLLDPLGLSATWYQVDERPRTTLTVGYRLVARSDGSVRPVKVAPASRIMPFRSVITAAGGAGSIASTALDTARWMRAFAGGDLLSPPIQQAMLDDAKISAALHAQVPYGLGIQVTDLAGHRALGHSGRYLGFRDVVRYLPDDGITIAVLTNQGTVDPSRIASWLIGIILPVPQPPVATPSAPAASPAASTAVPGSAATPVPAAGAASPLP